MMLNELTREELFLLVWERPSQEIARTLGISDVALGKRCKKLQVPKPPPGYWAKVGAGQRPRKPLLREFSEQLIERQNRAVRRRKSQRDRVGLSPLQADILRRAVDELSAAGVELGEMECTKTEVRALGSEVATQALLLIQKRYLKWLEERSNAGQVTHPSIRSVQALVSKLLPLAKPHVLLLEKKPDAHNRDNRGPKIVIRLTPAFIQQVANLRRLAAENNLTYAAWDLGTFEHTLIVQYQYDWYSHAHSKLCVSRDSLWVVCKVTHPWYEGSDETLETSKIPLADIAPVDLVPKADIALPGLLELPKLAISKRRIKAFIDIHNIHDILSNAVYRHDTPAPDDHLVLLEKLYLGIETGGPLTAARVFCKKLEDLMERWELILDAEGEAICAEALGLAVGDTVVAESHGKPVRLKLEHMGAFFHERRLTFHLCGKRYRKDGLLGKRDESIYLRANISL
ncbi:hypothetical protein CWI75_07885 [Kineobactrum sediminis]|uniref:Uncharacterized protein n=1 Tax=Kineobactrum sediminis TaxID=1905677 RepID=A0A2N5Y4J0_9GAMM|nr:hypothetical protein [Kineobactrum sediminis]PLW83310.1 hypothetical protein CWI75_07885 [Kineobactrum sediminis]